LCIAFVEAMLNRWVQKRFTHDDISLKWVALKKIVRGGAQSRLWLDDMNA
jgi:hypothetical protein